jgi:hypothetical protein
MAEGRVPEIVGQAQRFGEVFVEAECACHGPADLRDFEAVRQAHPVMVAIGRDEDLRLVPETAERDRVDQPIAITLENVPGTARTMILFRMKAAAGG